MGLVSLGSRVSCHWVLFAFLPLVVEPRATTEPCISSLWLLNTGPCCVAQAGLKFHSVA